MLANKLKAKMGKARIPQIFDGEGQLKHQPRQIADCFARYYTSLYNLATETDVHQPTLQDIFPFLNSLHLPQLSDNLQDELTRPITSMELTSALKGLPNGKAPGPDGFTVKYYKCFPDLQPHLLKFYQSIFESGQPPREWLAAHIVTIPKTPLPSPHCSQYRPISLLNVDTKLYAKIMAIRFAEVLPLLVADDQVGFIKNRQGPDNTLKILTLVDHVVQTSQPTLLLSLDAEKAFDRINWSYLHHVLLKFNFPVALIKAVEGLYTVPTAQVLNAGFTSDPIKISNGTRQGCPLSPLLYALALEPLAQAIRQASEVQGIHIGPTQSKVSLFADDILLTLTEPSSSLPALHEILDRYGKASYHKINLKKSQALSFAIPQETLLPLQRDYPYDWRKSHITYLGVKIAFSSADLFRYNYQPMLTQLRNLCMNWSKVEVSWAGRIAALKMSLLPKLLYLFRALPMALPRSYLPNLQSVLSRFVWRGKRPRVRAALLNQSIENGGMGVPNVLMYYKASMLTASQALLMTPPGPQWTRFLSVYFLPHSPSISLWLPRSLRPKLPPLPPFASLLRREWDNNVAKLINYHPIALAAPLSVLDHLIPNFDPRVWTRHGVTRLFQFFDQEGFLSFPRLIDKYAITDALWLSYGQIQSQLAVWGLGGRLSSKDALLSSFENRCSHPLERKKIISICYELLLKSTANKQWDYQRKWEIDLGRELPREQWRNSFSEDRSKFKCASLWEARKKLLYRWYLTPDRESHMSGGASSICWRCGISRGTYYHTWWTCPPLEGW
uniref:Reverse transcriptase domain-containing protein n=1 Tax=Leptobrachium leishanense TaxID=445787 RepID=A0A8C5QWS4_9ANUR